MRSLLSTFLLVLVVACAPAPQRISAPPATAYGNSTTVIYVVKRGWHIDIGFAVTDIHPPLTAVLAAFPNAGYLLFGFGDRRYLLAHGRNFGGMLGALWPGPGLVLATGLKASPEMAFGEENVIRIAVTDAEARHLEAFVWDTLSTQDGSTQDGSTRDGPTRNRPTQDGSPQDPSAQAEPTRNSAIAPIAAGPYDGSQYYASVQRYSAIHTCNTWAAESLRAASLPIHSVGVEFSGQLWTQVRRIERRGGPNG